MTVHTTYTEPGFNIGLTKMSAYIDVEVLISETANEDKVLAKMTVTEVPGRTAHGNDYDTGLRIQEAYAMAGKLIAKFLAKNTN